MFEIGDRVEVITSDDSVKNYSGMHGTVHQITWDYCCVVLLDSKAYGVVFLPRELKRELIK